MTKKEYILSVLDMFPDWEMWWWIKAMVQNNQLEEHTMNLLVIAFKRAMDKLAGVIKENKMLETIKALDSFNKQKKQQQEADAESLKNLDLKLSSI